MNGSNNRGLGKDGATIAAAAEAEFVSLWTSNRRIAAARKLFGVQTTREAVLAYQRQIKLSPGLTEEGPADHA